MEKNKKKSDRITTEKRVRVVYDWILQDHITTDIITQAVTSWGVSERQAYRYLNTAERLFEEANTRTLIQKKNYYLARKKKLLRDMNPEEKKTAAGVTAANKVLDSMAKLDGVSFETIKVIGDEEQPLHTKSRIEKAGEIDYSKLTDDELDVLMKIHAKTASN